MHAPHNPVEVPLEVQRSIQHLRIPDSESHKGENGKLLLIGGSELFHAASKWSLDVASSFVDMVFYASVPSNNELIQEAKGEFWNGIVIRREDVESYAAEADCILIGPGMTRTEDTMEIVERLVRTFPDKKWVIDAGALQMISPDLLNKNMIITPHPRELAMLVSKFDDGEVRDLEEVEAVEQSLRQLSETEKKAQLLEMSQKLGDVTVILKGKVDLVVTDGKVIQIPGGNAGMTKGGTGDVLAGLVAALACTNSLSISAIVGSFVNKASGDFLHEKVGPFFNASDLVKAVPETLWAVYADVRGWK